MLKGLLLVIGLSKKAFIPFAPQQWWNRPICLYAWTPLKYHRLASQRAGLRRTGCTGWGWTCYPHRGKGGRCGAGACVGPRLSSRRVRVVCGVVYCCVSVGSCVSGAARHAPHARFSRGRVSALGVGGDKERVDSPLRREGREGLNGRGVSADSELPARPYYPIGALTIPPLPSENRVAAYTPFGSIASRRYSSRRSSALSMVFGTQPSRLEAAARVISSVSTRNKV